jgi:putative ABC transport system permease protein
VSYQGVRYGHVRAVSAEFEDEREYMPVQYPVADGKNWNELASIIDEIPGVRAVFPRIRTMATLQDSTIKHAMLWGKKVSPPIGIKTIRLRRRGQKYGFTHLLIQLY